MARSMDPIARRIHVRYSMRLRSLLTNIIRPPAALREMAHRLNHLHGLGVTADDIPCAPRSDPLFAAARALHLQGLRSLRALVIELLWVTAPADGEWERGWHDETELALAFAMGDHPRVGRGSMVAALGSEMVALVVGYCVED